MITTPIVDTVFAWLADERIDKDSYTTVMRQWVRSAYGPDESESPIHALERGEVTDAEFEQILAAALVNVDGGPVPAQGLLKRMFAASVIQAEMLDLVRELRGQRPAHRAAVQLLGRQGRRLPAGPARPSCSTWP